MARDLRIHYPGAVYHAITRGNNKQRIFNSDSDYRRLLSILNRVKDVTQFSLYAYCLMPNHVHLLIKVKDQPLSNIMQRILTSYVLKYNWTYKRTGHLFQGRYRVIHCDKDSYLLELVRYIHLNPVRAKLVKSPSDWKWSGHNGYLSKYDDPLIESDPIYSQLSPIPINAKRIYMQFLKDGVSDTPPVSDTGS